MAEIKKPELKQQDVFELINNILHKNGMPVTCPIASAILVPKQALVGNQLSFEEKRMACNRSCPHSVLYKIKYPDQEEEKFVHETRCVHGWPKNEVNIIDTLPKNKKVVN